MSTFGFSKELLAFVDHDQVLSTAIPEIPSLESYLLDSDIDLSSATESILRKIKQTTQRFSDAFFEHLCNYRSWYSSAVKYLAVITAVIRVKGDLIKQ